MDPEILLALGFAERGEKGALEKSEYNIMGVAPDMKALKVENVKGRQPKGKEVEQVFAKMSFADSLFP